MDSLDRPVDITLTGGEALLTRDLERIMDYMMSSRHVRYLGLLTNGSMPRRLGRSANRCSSATPARS